MTPEAYYYICIAYGSIALLTGFGLILKRYKASFMYPESIEYLLHGLHIPPYMIASYWYWDAYNEYE